MTLVAKVSQVSKVTLVAKVRQVEGKLRLASGWEREGRGAGRTLT